MGLQDFQPLRSPCSQPASSPEHQTHLKTEKNIQLIRKNRTQRARHFPGTIKGKQRESKRRRKASRAPSSHFFSPVCSGLHVRNERTAGLLPPSAPFTAINKINSGAPCKPVRLEGSWGSDPGSPSFSCTIVDIQASPAGILSEPLQSLQRQVFYLLPREPARGLSYSRLSFFSASNPNLSCWFLLLSFCRVRGTEERPFNAE